MAYIAESAPETEPVSAGWIDAIANAGLYHVIEGCAVTYDPSDLTVDIAAGIVLHNGSEVTVAAQSNAVTLVPDATNPRWAWITVDNTGDGVVVHGDAAAVDVDTPAVPSPGDRVVLALVLVEAAATVANSLTTKLDKRVFWPAQTKQARAEVTSAQNFANSTLANVTELVLPVEANTNYAFELVVAYLGSTTGRIKTAFALPSGAKMTAINSYIDSTGDVQTGMITNTTANAQAYASTTTPFVITYRGIITIAATAGDVQVQAAQAVTHGTQTQILPGSVLKFL